MKVLNLPFTKKIGITKSDKPEYLLQLETSAVTLNHIGTAHGSATYALAEITSGYYLSMNFADIANDTLPILRSSSTKYKKACNGVLYSKARILNTTMNDVLLHLKFKRKCLFSIEVKLYNEEGTIVLKGEFEWYVTMVK